MHDMIQAFIGDHTQHPPKHLHTRRRENVKYHFLNSVSDRLCGLVVSVADYKHRGPGFDSRALLRILLRELGLERGPLSLVIG
jgi:hypothetical protein